MDLPSHISLQPCIRIQITQPPHPIYKKKKMKRVRCPKCDEFITFDETRYEKGQSLVFACPQCGKQFGIRIGQSKLRDTQKVENSNEASPEENGFGSIIVIENVFHYKQVIPLKLGNNTIGRYMKGSRTNTPIETNDPSIDINHCTINVSKDKNGKLKYILSDGPSYTGTFVDNEILGDREKRVIYDGTLFTIGATSIILKTADSKDAEN